MKPKSLFWSVGALVILPAAIYTFFSNSPLQIVLGVSAAALLSLACLYFLLKNYEISWLEYLQGIESDSSYQQTEIYRSKERELMGQIDALKEEIKEFQNAKENLEKEFFATKELIESRDIEIKDLTTSYQVQIEHLREQLMVAEQKREAAQEELALARKELQKRQESDTQAPQNENLQLPTEKNVPRGTFLPPNCDGKNSFEFAIRPEKRDSFGPTDCLIQFQRLSQNLDPNAWDTILSKINYPMALFDSTKREFMAISPSLKMLLGLNKDLNPVTLTQKIGSQPSFFNSFSTPAKSIEKRGQVQLPTSWNNELHCNCYYLQLPNPSDSIWALSFVPQK